MIFLEFVFTGSAKCVDKALQQFANCVLMLHRRADTFIFLDKHIPFQPDKSPNHVQTCHFARIKNKSLLEYLTYPGNSEHDFSIIHR